MCADNGTEETREECEVECECEFTESEFDDDVEGESGVSWESESNANDSLYIPTPIRKEKARPIDLPNKLGFITLPKLGKFLETMNEARGCKTPGCKGNVVPTHVHSQWLGGTFSITGRKSLDRPTRIKVESHI